VLCPPSQQGKGRFQFMFRFTFIQNYCGLQVLSVVGVLADDVDPMVSVMKLEKAPTESYADIGGLDTQIQEIKVSLPSPNQTKH